MTRRLNISRMVVAEVVAVVARLRNDCYAALVDLQAETLEEEEKVKSA